MRQLPVTLLLVLLASVTAKTKPRIQADDVFLERQRKVLQIYVGLGADYDKFNHVHSDFPLDKPEYFQKPDVYERFLKVYNRGLLARDSVFTMNCHKTRHDTFKLFDILYFAKDFDTFYKIAEWAKYELHPYQLSFALTAAILHREDTKGFTVPPLYEIHPHFFVPSHVMTDANQAKAHDVKYRKFDYNNSGWEWSWHRDMTSGPQRTGPQWTGDDSESWVSFFREDVGLAESFTKFLLYQAPWVSQDRYPAVRHHRRGEVLYIVTKWLKNMYNLHRYSSGLAPAEPFDFDIPYKHGYNPHLVDVFGVSLLPRPDNLVPHKANNYGFWEVEQTERRYYDAIDFGHFVDVRNISFIPLDEENGLDILTRALFGVSDSIGRGYYKPWFYHVLEAANDMVKSSNDREYTRGVLGSLITFVRDPAFFSILTSMNEILDSQLEKLKPYSREELSFPGVEIEKLDVDKLITFFEKFEFEVTNGVAIKEREERKEKKYVASGWRINHKPFSYRLAVKSDKDVDAFVRVYLGPKSDMESRPLSLSQSRNGFVHIDVFHVKLTPGENVIERESHHFGLWEQKTHFRDVYEKVNRSIETKEPYYYTEFNDCSLPRNLMLPMGSRSGKDFQLLVVVTPLERSAGDGFSVCGYNKFFDQFSVYFPLDRRVIESHFDSSNILFKDVTIFLKTEQEVNRPQTD